MRNIFVLLLSVLLLALVPSTSAIRISKEAAASALEAKDYNACATKCKNKYPNTNVTGYGICLRVCKVFYG